MKAISRKGRAMFLMTNRDDTKVSEVLIEKVCSYPCLYDPANISYKSKRHKKLCWIKIGLELHLDAAVVKTKWKNLRDRYVRERRSERRGQSAPRKEWVLYKHLTFLEPFVSSLESRGAGEGDCVSHFLDLHSYSKSVKAEPTTPTKQPLVYILPAPQPPPPDAPKGTAAKRPKLGTVKDKMAPGATPHLEKRFAKYVNQQGVKETEEYSSDEMFVLSLVPCFSKLTESRKDKLKLDMHKLVYEAVYSSN